MTEPLKRDDIIELLNKLGSERDEDVLEAARQAHARIAEAGVTWDVLLVPDGGGKDTGEDEIDDDDIDDEDDIGDTDIDEDDDDIDDEDDISDTDIDEDDDDIDDDDDDDTGEAPAAKVGNFADSLKLIDKLLARKGISDNLREELKGYKTDIAEDEFTELDRRYLDALHKRLSK